MFFNQQFICYDSAMSFFNRRKKFTPTEQDLADMEQVEQHLAQIKSEMPPEIVEAHKHSSNNRREIGKSKLCGCFYCLLIYQGSEIEEWVNGKTTAICPRCGVDSVLGDAAGFDLTPELLETMHKHWF